MPLFGADWSYGRVFVPRSTIKNKIGPMTATDSVYLLGVGFDEDAVDRLSFGDCGSAPLSSLMKGLRWGVMVWSLGLPDKDAGGVVIWIPRRWCDTVPPMPRLLHDRSVDLRTDHREGSGCWWTPLCDGIDGEGASVWRELAAIYTTDSV